MQPRHANVIVVDNLCKSYKQTPVLNQLALQVPEGSIFGLLGPNGAGKTTLIEILEGIRGYDQGSVTVCGLDPRRHARQLKRLVGVQLQETVLNDANTVGEIFALFASFYSQDNWDAILTTITLQGKQDTLYKDLSGGQRQLLAIGLALLGSPRLIFLDEPTVGLDVHARQEIYAAIKRIKANGNTVFLTTHYLEEAENLCDLVAILDQGKIMAYGSPHQLLMDELQSGKTVTFELKDRIDEDQLRARFNTAELVCVDGRYTALVANAEQFSHALSLYAAETGNSILSMNINQSRLQDLFMKLTTSPVDAQ